MFPTESGSEPTSFSASGCPWHPRQSTLFVAELKTRLGALCGNEATTSPRIVDDESIHSGTTELPDYTGTLPYNYSLSANLQGIGSQFPDSATFSHSSDDIQR